MSGAKVVTHTCSFNPLTDTGALLQAERKPSRKCAHGVSGARGGHTTDGAPPGDSGRKHEPGESVLLKAVLYLGPTGGSQGVQKPLSPSKCLRIFL